MHLKDKLNPILRVKLDFYKSFKVYFSLYVKDLYLS